MADYPMEDKDDDRENYHFRLPTLIYENPNAVLRFSALNEQSKQTPNFFSLIIRHYHRLVTKLMRILRIVNRETAILAKLRLLLSDNRNLKTQLSEHFAKISLTRPTKLKANRSSSKYAHLARLYEQVKLHRTCLLDSAIYSLKEMKECFMVFEILDYPRLLYTSRQIVKCKSILMASLRESTESYNFSKFPIPSEDFMHLNETPAHTNSNFNGFFQSINNFQESSRLANNDLSMNIESSNVSEDKYEYDFLQEVLKKIKP